MRLLFLHVLCRMYLLLMQNSNVIVFGEGELYVLAYFVNACRFKACDISFTESRLAYIVKYPFARCLNFVTLIWELFYNFVMNKLMRMNCLRPPCLSVYVCCGFTYKYISTMLLRIKINLIAYTYLNIEKPFMKYSI